ncbi:hypothetical protein EVA_20168 [gut metagenome]|uniref:GNAT family N-acetyltransferase n=1 Tax=gut metagenome TaxID=749906 RepID=J9FBB1_9ZZZZ
MENYNDGIRVLVTDHTHEKYTESIRQLLTACAQERHNGIAVRSSEYLATKMKERKAVIALYGEELAGFCYIESWKNKNYIAHSGLVVAPQFRQSNLATRIKQLTFALSRIRWPHAKIFGLTCSPAVLHIDTALGYVPVAFTELTQDEEFWRSCGSPEHPRCVNCNLLFQSDRKFCQCTALLYDPKYHVNEPLPVQVPQEVIDSILQKG